MLKSQLINIVYILAVFVLLIVFVYYPINIPLVLIALCLFLSYNIMGIFYMPANVFTKNLCLAETDRKEIAITFDDGPVESKTQKILEILDKYNIKATFFLIGSNIESNRDIVKEIAGKGHLIGNHSYDHDLKFTFSKADSVFQNLDKTELLIEKITGNRIKIFRPPFGVTNPSIAKAVKRKFYYSIGWSCRSLDTKILDNDKFLNRLKKNLKPGAVFLFHDYSDITVNNLETFILFAKEQEYSFVKVDELFEIRAYDKIN